MQVPRALLVAVVAMAMVIGLEFGGQVGAASQVAMAVAPQALADGTGSPGLQVVALDDNDNEGEEEIQTGGGKDAEDFGLSDGVVNPGAEDLGIKHDDDDDDDD